MIPRKTPDKSSQRSQSKLPGAVRYRPPKGKKSDRPLEKLHQEHNAKKRTTRR